MKTMKKVGAVILALCMCMALCVTAFAATGEGYEITIENATIGADYAAYKIFDATYDEETGGVSYTISTSSALYESVAALTDVFDLKAATTDADTYYVTVKDGVSDADVIAAIEDLGIEDLVEASASTDENGATSTTVVLDVGEPGYYYITSSLGAVVTITTAAPAVTVLDKNEVVGQDFAKYIIDENGNVIGSMGDAALGDELSFDITSSVPRYEGSDPVVEYVFTDTLGDTGLEIEIELESEEESDEHHISIVDGHYYADDSLINKFVTFTGTTVDNSTGELVTYTLKDVAYDYTLEFTDVTYDEESGYIVCGGFILTYYTYESTTDADGNTVYDLSSSKYPTDLTIDIIYTTYVTDNANHFETNTASLVYYKYDPDEGIIPGDNSGKTSTDIVYDWDLKIVKVDGEDGTHFLEGATFTLAGTNLKDVMVSSSVTYTSIDASEMEEGVTYYYKLADGTFTTVAPTQETMDQYDPTTPGPYVRSYKSNVEVADAEDHTVTGTTNEDGVLIFDGLSAGTYILTEIVAPDGYNLLTEPIEFTVTFSSSTSQFSVSITSGLEDSSIAFDNETEELSFTIENNTGSELPSTGGMGTTIFYIVGAVLICGAAVVLITRRRMAR